MGIENPILLDLPLPIITKRITIRPIKPGDGNIMNEAVKESEEQFKKWLPWSSPLPSNQASEIMARCFYARYIMRHEMHFIILYKNKLIGMCSLQEFDWNKPSCSIGYWCRISEQGKGYMTEAIFALLELGFKSIGLKFITIQCKKKNIKSINLALRCGFKFFKEEKNIHTYIVHNNDSKII